MGQRSGMSPERLRELIVAHTGSVRNRSLVIGLALVAGAIIGGLTDGLLAASGEPYGVLAVLIPIVLHGTPEAFQGHKRVVTASFDLTMIPSPKGSPVVLTTSFTPAWFTGDRVLYERPDMLPVIIK